MLEVVPPPVEKITTVKRMEDFANNGRRLIWLAVGGFFAVLGIETAIGIGLRFGSDGVSAYASLIAAGAAIAIPIVLARSASVDAEATKRRTEKMAEVAAMHEIIQQYQSYNLAVASGQIARVDLPDTAFGELEDSEIRQLHVMFFRLTALDQLYYALKEQSVDPEWANTIIRDIGTLCRADPRLYALATTNRGYTDEFLAHLNQVCGPAVHLVTGKDTPVVHATGVEPPHPDNDVSNA